MSKALTTWNFLGARFAFDIYDFEGKARMDLFYLGDVLRGLNCSPTLAKIEALGGTKKKGEKFITLEEFYPIYSEMKKALKDMGSFEDFVECCKLYDKQENVVSREILNNENPLVSRKRIYCKK